MRARLRVFAALAALALTPAPGHADERATDRRSTVEASPPGEAEARPPWAPERWLTRRPSLLAVRPLLDPPGITLTFGPRDDPRVELVRPAPDRIGLHVAGVTRPPAPPPLRPPFADGAWNQTPSGATLTATVPPGTRLALRRIGPSWHLRVDERAPPITPPPRPERDAIWAETPTVGPAPVELHRAVAEGHAGRGPQAIGRLETLLAERLPRPIRAAVHLVEARLALREGLALVALDAAARVSRWTADPLTRRAAHRLMLTVEARLPGALALVAYDLQPDLLARGTPEDGPMALEVGRALLRLDDPEGAAELLHRAHVDIRVRHRARFLAHVAARLAGDGAAADAHLAALAAEDAETLAPALRIERLLARARRIYESPVGDAAAAYAEAAALAVHLGDTRRAETIRVEQGWVALRAGHAVGTLNRLLPLDLDTHGAPRALLVATLYHRLCHPRRAAAVASALIERLQLDPISRAFSDERGILGRATWDVARPVLAQRLATLKARYESMLALSPETFWLRQAHRARVGADTRAANEVELRMREDHLPPPEEWSVPEWRGATWAEAEPIGDRCALLGITPPIGAEADLSESALESPPVKGR